MLINIVPTFAKLIINTNNIYFLGIMGDEMAIGELMQKTYQDIW